MAPQQSQLTVHRPDMHVTMLTHRLGSSEGRLVSGCTWSCTGSCTSPGCSWRPSCWNRCRLWTSQLRSRCVSARAKMCHSAPASPYLQHQAQPDLCVQAAQVGADKRALCRIAMLVRGPSTCASTDQTQALQEPAGKAAPRHAEAVQGACSSGDAVPGVAVGRLVAAAYCLRRGQHLCRGGLARVDSGSLEQQHVDSVAQVAVQLGDRVPIAVQLLLQPVSNAALRKGEKKRLETCSGHGCCQPAQDEWVCTPAAGTGRTRLASEDEGPA